VGGVELDALRSIGDQLLAGPARRGDAPAQIVYLLLGKIDVERPDRGSGLDGRAHALPPSSGDPARRTYALRRGWARQLAGVFASRSYATAGASAAEPESAGGRGLAPGLPCGKMTRDDHDGGGGAMTFAQRMHKFLHPAPPHVHPIDPAVLQHDKERADALQNRVADRITAFSGSMLFVYVHIIWFACWIGFGVESYPYGLLTMIVSLEAICLSAFVLTSP